MVRRLLFLDFFFFFDWSSKALINSILYVVFCPDFTTNVRFSSPIKGVAVSYIPVYEVSMGYGGMLDGWLLACLRA